MTKAQREKLKSELSGKKADYLGDIWKIYRDKKLSDSELIEFNIMREVYKEKTGNALPKNTHDAKGK